MLNLLFNIIASRIFSSPNKESISKMYTAMVLSIAVSVLVGVISSVLIVTFLAFSSYYLHLLEVCTAYVLLYFFGMLLLILSICLCMLKKTACNKPCLESSDPDVDLGSNVVKSFLHGFKNSN